MAAEFGERLTLMSGQDLLKIVLVASKIVARMAGVAETLVLPGASVGLKDLRRFMPTENRRSFEVVRKPMVAVRTLPHKDALIAAQMKMPVFQQRTPHIPVSIVGICEDLEGPVGACRYLWDLWVPVHTCVGTSNYM